jgi:putative DNA methylase
MTAKKKLIEVALPLEAINEEGSRRKRKAPAGYPTTLHKWWAQRPIAAARAVIFAQMVDDPSSLPDLFPTEAKQQKERERLFRIIEDLVQWENTTNGAVLERARTEIWQSWRRACAENADHPRAKELFDRKKLPAFHDPFAGSGAIPMEAQRLGLEAYASDLNPVAVLINKAMIEIPPRFAGRPPANLEARKEKALIAREWKGAQGLAADVRYYGQWMRDEAEKRIGLLYPKIEVTVEMAKDRPDLKPYVGQKLTVIAWLWARTVKSPNPAFAKVDVPLASTFMLSTKAGKEAYVEPVIQDGGYRFTVKVGKPKNAERAKNGTKLSRGANFECLMSGTPIASEHIYGEAQAGRMGARLMAIVAEGRRGRVYLAPTAEHETAVGKAKPEWKPDVAMPDNPRWFSPPLYGLTTYGDLFTPRQLVALTTFSDLVGEAMQQVRRDALKAGLPDDPAPLGDDGTGATAYAEAVGVYLAMAISRLADYGSSIATWRPKDNAMRSTMPKQAIQMAWDFAEGSPFGTSSSGFEECVDVVSKVMERALPGGQGGAKQNSVQEVVLANSRMPVVSTDPPYYDNVGYGDLSDFFYVWLRRTLRGIYPNLFATVAVPKAEELIATPYRHGSREQAEAFFLEGMTQAMHRLVEQAHPAFPVTIYYAFKQSESDTDAGTASTGWETFLDAVIRAGFSIGGTWPMRTEGDNRQLSLDTNALASSIVLVCRKRAENAPTATRREFVVALKTELPTALRRLQEGNIAPVDLAQAAIGPGMAVYTRYAKVLDAEGKPVPVRDALALINQVLDETLAEQEGDFDADSRFALAWFEQHGFAEGEFGVADVLARAKNTSVDGLREAGILESKRGKVRLFKPDELPGDWDPATDARLMHWETVHHLIRALEAGGESAAAALVAKVGTKAETARELAYRLYTVCERKKRAAAALSYNALVQSFPEITRLAREGGKPKVEQAAMFGEAEE